MDRSRYKENRFKKNKNKDINSVNNRNKNRAKNVVIIKNSTSKKNKTEAKKNNGYKDSIKLKNNTKVKNKIGLMYKTWVAISFIIIQFIQPVWGEKGLIRILKGMMQVSISAIGVISIDANRYITRRNGWEQLDKLLKDKGYETHILFRQCEFWMNDGIKKKLKGRNIGEFFILWEGDEI